MRGPQSQYRNLCKFTTEFVQRLILRPWIRTSRREWPVDCHYDIGRDCGNVTTLYNWVAALYWICLFWFFPCPLLILLSNQRNKSNGDHVRSGCLAKSHPNLWFFLFAFTGSLLFLGKRRQISSLANWRWLFLQGLADGEKCKSTNMNDKSIVVLAVRRPKS